MAKIIKKKVGKLKLKKSKPIKSRPVANDEASVVSDEPRGEDPGGFKAVSDTIRYDEDEGEDDLNPELSADDEDEADEEDERKRNKLVQAISSMGAGHRSTRLEERSEAACLVSEFGVDTEGERTKIQLSDLIPTASKKAQKQIQTLQNSHRTLDTPLSRQETERIHRDVAFQKVSAEVSQWKSVIQQNQRSEQLVFPLNQEPSGPKRIEQVVVGWRAQTPLEQEVFAVLHANRQPIHDPVLTPREEESIRAMSLEEAKVRRAELQKARALQSYYEAKARRERKIKSKKYHKVHNKAKRREMLKKFDEMVKTDPEGALEELRKLETARMQERMSLKHQNSGKWAKSKAIMAKYDEDARKAMQQQLELNKELTQKVASALNDEEDEEETEAETEEVLPDFVNDAEKAGDASNPWMRGKLTEEEPEREEEAKLNEEVIRMEEEDEEEEEANEEDKLLQEFENRRKKRREEEKYLHDEEQEDPVAEEELTEFTSIIRGLTQKPEVEAVEDDSAGLEEGLTRIQTLDDTENLENLETLEDVEPKEVEMEEIKETSGKKVKKKKHIDLKEVMTKECRAVTVPLTVTTEEAEDGGLEDGMDQRGLIKEAFAGDDVVSDFLKEKRKQEDAAKPKALDLTLPGWGEWGGQGLKTSQKKRRRFKIKPAPAAARKDARLPDVILSEQRDRSVAAHQVSSLPFPFENHSQFESTIRCPLGRTWNTEKTVGKATQPRVLTQLGAIIEPMGREELQKSLQRKAETANGNNERKGPPGRRGPPERMGPRHAPKRKKHKQ